jgi:hypothetical protein
MGIVLIGLYLALVTFTYLACLAWLVLGSPPSELTPVLLGLKCAITGGLGGCVYCLRGVYLNYSVQKRWSSDWYPWYIIRPLVSVASGAVAYLFLKAGLLILESGTRADASELGFYAVAFIAGLNVDKFLKKIEEIAQSVWGIEKSRTSSRQSDEDGSP